jgi:4-amino-4-deoxy-L-arabinose transferase-like glycosyltransferase
MRPSPWFFLLWCAFIGIATLYALFTPAWQTPDEPAHYNYVKQLAEGSFPIMQMGDYDQGYFGEVISSRFAPHYSIAPFRYQDYQPPLYYLLLTPIYRLTDGNLFALRLTSVGISALTLIFVYLVAWQVLGERDYLALTAAGFWAFLPQNVAMMSSVNNDVLAALWIALLLWLLVRYQPTSPQHRQRLLTMGVILGCAFLTKVTAYLMAPVIFLVLVVHYLAWSPRRWREFFYAGCWVFIPALLLGSLWWGRNLWVYGWPDFLGTQAHDAVVVGQPTTAEWIQQYGSWYVLNAFVQTSFQSFWGQFGWMAVPMPGWVYTVLRLFTWLISLGLLAEFVRFTQRTARAQAARQALLVAHLPAFVALGSLFLLNVLLYLTYNVTYVQHQGRYLFAALIPLSTAVALGSNLYIRPLYHRYPPATYLLPLALNLLLFGLCLYALFWMIVPNLG